MADSTKVKIIKLKSDSKYERLFNKESGTCGIKSGHVILKEGEEIGEHSTGGLEEVLVILKGKGTLVIDEEKKLDFENNSVLYIPPETTHNVRNTAKAILEYIFITSNAEQKL